MNIMLIPHSWILRLLEKENKFFVLMVQKSSLFQTYLSRTEEHRQNRFIDPEQICISEMKIQISLVVLEPLTQKDPNMFGDLNANNSFADMSEEQ